MKKFVCSGCGNCCKYFGKNKTLPLFGDEKKRFIYSAKKLGIILSFIPENLCLDKKSGFIFCGNWGMVGDPCPFLDLKNKCKIYKKRAFICKSFPIEKILTKKDIINASCFMKCANNSSINFINEATKVNNINMLYKNIYGTNSFMARKEIIKRKNFIDDNLKKLKKDKKIELAEINFINYDNLKILDIFDFLKKFKIVYI